MPTPVPTARQCLTNEAAKALDDAVLVAKKRNHSQTTSLHIISSLLSHPHSLLRDSLTRARSSSYSPRLQLRALELCVSVSLDRLPTVKLSSSSNDEFAPPVSNSLMAAIKRSQANQRRQPELFYSNVTNNSNLTINGNVTNNGNMGLTAVKVELKNFVISILDDPIVSRVLGEAGFRSSEIKMEIISPPVGLGGLGRWGSAARCPPVFLCNLVDGYGGRGGGGDGNGRRIGEVMGKERERSPVLVGVCAKDALDGFLDCLEKGSYLGLPKIVEGAKVVSLEGFGFDEVVKKVGILLNDVGVVVNVGDLKVFVDDEESEKSEKDLIFEGFVREMRKLVEKKRIWVIGFVANYETYAKFVRRFPSVERDWDLCPLPITSSSSSSSSCSKPSFDAKSSLMGSFVPFGGFFPTPSDFRPPFVTLKQPFTRCHACNEKYEQELCAMLREGSSLSVADKYLTSLPSWLQQRSDADTTKGTDGVAQVKAVSNDNILGLQKKWDEHCQRLHQALLYSAPGVSLAQPLVPRNLPLQIASDKQGSCTSSDNSSLNEGVCSNSSSSMQVMAQNASPKQMVMAVDLPKKSLEVSECLPSVRESSAPMAYPVCSLGQPVVHKPTPSVSVTTDLGLGTIYVSEGQKKPFLRDHQANFPHNRSSISFNPVIQSSFQGDPDRFDLGEYKALYRKLIEVVEWQSEAISRISEIVSCCRSGNGRQRTSNMRGNIWLSFQGPDKIGKRRVAEALANVMCDSKDRLIAVDLSYQDKTRKVNSLFHCQESSDFDTDMSRMTMVDHIAQELCKKPRSVVFLENVDEADPLVRNSLSRAIQTGRFQDSRGREISVNNVIFIATSTLSKEDSNISPRKEFIKFKEEKILEAKNWQMKMAFRSVPGDTVRNHETKVSIVSEKSVSDQGASKREFSEISNSSEQCEAEKRLSKKSKHSLDLNLPLEDEVEMESCYRDSLLDSSRAWLEGFFGQADGNVLFRPFDFDSLADKLLRRIRLKFEETCRGETPSLEIDFEVMVQILAAAWLSETKGACEGWIEQVLSRSFAELREKYGVTSATVVRFMSCEGVPVTNWDSGICLPKIINLSI